MLEPRRKLGCFASTVSSLFFLLNVAFLTGAMMFGGLSIYFWIKEDVPASLGMQEVRVELACCAAGLALTALFGMFATAEDSRLLCKFFMVTTVMLMVVQAVSSIHFMFLPSYSRLTSAWEGLTQESRHSMEIKMMCCGFNVVSESAGCIASKTAACGNKIVDTQKPIFTLLTVSSIIIVILEVVAMIMAQYLSGKYYWLKSRSTSSPLSTTLPAMHVQQATQLSPKHSLPPSFRTSLPTGVTLTSDATRSVISK